MAESNESSASPAMIAKTCSSGNIVKPASKASLTCTWNERRARTSPMAVADTRNPCRDLYIVEESYLFTLSPFAFRFAAYGRSSVLAGPKACGWHACDEDSTAFR